MCDTKTDSITRLNVIIAVEATFDLSPPTFEIFVSGRGIDYALRVRPGSLVSGKVSVVTRSGFIRYELYCLRPSPAGGGMCKGPD